MKKNLVAALKSGKVASARLYVFWNEPAVEDGLLRNPRVVLLPHIGTKTYETQKDMELFGVEEFRVGCRGGKASDTDTQTERDTEW